MEEELFKEVELAGRGTGLVASCDLQPGVLLLAEPPLLTVPWWQRLTQFNRSMIIPLKILVFLFFHAQAIFLVKFGQKKLASQIPAVLSRICDSSNFVKESL